MTHEGKCRWCGVTIKRMKKEPRPDIECLDCWKTQNQQFHENRYDPGRVKRDMSRAYQSILGYGADGLSTAEQLDSGDEDPW